MIASRLKRLFVGGSAGNEHLTLAVAALLLVLLAVEGATILDVGAFLTVHAFVGMLLIPVVALKVASTGWRHARATTVAARSTSGAGRPTSCCACWSRRCSSSRRSSLFGTGVALLALDQTDGTLVGLHKASFIVWFGAVGLHVLAHLLRLPRLWRLRAPGIALRVTLVARLARRRRSAGDGDAAGRRPAAGPARRATSASTRASSQLVTVITTLPRGWPSPW